MIELTDEEQLELSMYLDVGTFADFRGFVLSSPEMGFKLGSRYILIVAERQFSFTGRSMFELYRPELLYEGNAYGLRQVFSLPASAENIDWLKKRITYFDDDGGLDQFGLKIERPRLKYLFKYFLYSVKERMKWLITS